MKDGLVDRAEVLRIIQEARESGETDLRSIRALVECLPAATPPTTPSAAAMRAAAAEEIAAWIFRLEQPLTSETDLRVAQDIVAAIITRHLAAADAPETVELQIARRFLVKMGYVRCVSAACGCNSWHERRL